MTQRRISLVGLTQAQRTALITVTAVLALIATVVTATVVSGHGSGTARAATPTPGTSETSGAPGKGAGPSRTSAAPHTPAAPTTPPVPASIQHAPEARGKAVNVTIDDGPDPLWTPKVLDVLKHNHVKATFCMIGPQARAHPDLVRRIVAEGHRLCDHTVSHNEAMNHKSFAYQKREILDALAMIQQASGGAPVSYYRAPGGAFTPASRALAAQHGMRPLGWNIDTKDYTRPGAGAILHTLQYEIHNGPTILLHDGGGERSQTVSALKQALPWLRRHGYAFSFPKIR